MARLGQLLVRADLVSENNLARALGIQHFAGGRLGTLLLERGSIDEDSLGKTLALQHGCEYIPWSRLAEIPPMVIAVLPAKFAIKHAAVPYDRGENSLKLALRDPGDLRILDELFFVTGRKIIAGVAPEVRIYQALEKYYGERRTPRYAILTEKLTRPARSAKAAAAMPPPPPDFFPSPRRRRPGAVPRPGDIWGDAGETDMGEPSIIQSWTVPDQSIEQPVGGWAGSVSQGLENLPPPEPETISWEEMPSVPGMWISETSSPPPVSIPPSTARSTPSRESVRVFKEIFPEAPPIAPAFVNSSTPAPGAPPSAPQIPAPPRESVTPRLVPEQPVAEAEEIVPAHEAASHSSLFLPAEAELPAPEEALSKPALVEHTQDATAPSIEQAFLQESAQAPAQVEASDAAPPLPPVDVAASAEATVAPPRPDVAPPLPEPPEAPPSAAAAPPLPPPPAFAALPSATDFPGVAAAADRDAIATAALDALARRFVRAAVFVSRPEIVTAWGGVGEGVSPEELRDIEIPWKDPSIFLNIRLCRSFYLGPLPPLPRHESIAIAMGGWPEECLVQPIFIKERPVAFLYAEFAGEQGATPMDLAYMRELAAAASSAFVAAIRLKKREI